MRRSRIHLLHQRAEHALRTHLQRLHSASAHSWALIIITTLRVLTAENVFDKGSERTLGISVSGLRGF